MAEDVDEDERLVRVDGFLLHGRPEPGSYFGHEDLVVFHVLEELDAEDAVVGAFLRGLGEGVGGDIACDDFEILEVVFAGLRVDVLFLGAGVGEGGDLAVGEDFGEV